MAIIYISYQHNDKGIVNSLTPLLEAKGHTLWFDEGLFIGAVWREHLMGDLLASDVVLLIWSKNTYKSQYVPAEVGMVRATPRLGLLPVVIGDVAIPPFIQDLFVEQITDTRPETLKALAKNLDESIKKHIAHRNLRKKERPKVFISHRHKDEKLVSALVDCIRAYFSIEKKDIRCTSVRPYRLPVGENTGDRLRDEITDAEVVLGILTTDTLESSYVAFELGSAWGQRVWTCPLLARGADQGHIPDPIRGLSPLFLSKEGDCHQLLSDMEGFTSLVKRKGFNKQELEKKIRGLVRVAKEPPGDGQERRRDNSFDPTTK
ncbi:MAG TPA: toll/interleukin-1 receptor domain-containing protein [Pyrinomonadaceae bacterium]|nr:toll/interleukin-1 receptor domain-containing protein [Pyrinomonadaceae bacterium]